MKRFKTLQARALFVFAMLIAVEIASQSFARADGPCTNYRGSSKACYCPSGQRPAVFSLVCSYYVDNSGNQCSAETCMGSCNCQNIPQEQTSTPPQPIRRETPDDDEASLPTPSITATPDDDAARYWKIPNSCVPAWRYFRSKAAHGAFAVTKRVDNGGCGWSWSPSRPIEEMRRQAMATCAKYGADCKIVGEK